MYEELFRERGLSLDRLHAFLAVAEAGSIAGASRGEPIRQSQLSRQLSELEAFFGRPLTERRRGRRVLTEEGRRLAEHIRWTLSGLSEFKRGEDGAVDAPFTLAAGDSVLAWLVLPRISEVAARFSVVALPVHEVVAGLVEGRVDLGIVRRDTPIRGLESLPLGRLEHALFVPRALVPRGVSDEEIPFRVPLAVQVSDRDFTTSATVTARRRGRALEIRLSCETFPQVFRAVRSGKFAGLLPTFARAELPPSRFREVVFGSRHACRLHLAWSRPLLRVRPSAQRTIDQLGEVLRATPEAAER